MWNSPEVWDWCSTRAAPFALAMARVLGLVWPITAWGLAGMGARARLVLAAVGAAVILPAAWDELAVAVSACDGTAGLAAECVGELARGLVLGLSAALVAGAARQGGELIGLSAGLSPQVDPGPAGGLAGGESDEPLTPAGALYVALAIAAFLTLDGPLAMVMGLVESYRLLPAGGGWPETRGAVELIGQALSMSVRIATPVVLPLLIAQAAVAYVTRLGPSMPWSSMAWPMRIALSMVLIGLGAAWTLGALRQAWAVVVPGLSP